MDEGGLVSPIVVHDQVDIKVDRHGGLYSVQKLAELHRSMALMALPDDLAGLGVESGEQGCGAMPNVVMGTPLQLTWTHWQ